MEKVVVAGVALDSKQVKFSLQNTPNVPGVAAKIFGALGAASVVVDVIALDVPAQGVLTISFTVSDADRLKSREVLEKLIPSLGGVQKVVLSEADKLAKVSIVGVGMQNHPGVAARMFALLGEAGVNIRLISTSEIKISCMVDDERGQDAVRALHKGFELERLG
jgi:aspartate kinase